MRLVLSPRRTLVAILTVGALAALPGAAAAKPGYVVIPQGRVTQLVNLKASNGYWAQVMIFNRQVTLTVHGHHGSAAYTVRGQVGADGIRARFGKLGRLRLHFAQRGKPKAIPELLGRCRGRAPTFRWGRVTGIVRFRGELGFTRIRSRGGTALTARFFRMVCKRVKGEDEGESLEALENNPGTAASTSFRPPAGAAPRSPSRTSRWPNSRRSPDSTSRQT